MPLGCLIIYKSSVYQELCDILTYNLSKHLEVYSCFSLATFKQYSKLSYGNFRFVNRGGPDSSLSLLLIYIINDVKNMIYFKQNILSVNHFEVI